MPTKIKGTSGIDKVEAGAVITDPIFEGNATVNGTGYLKIPAGTTAQRPVSPTVGMLRYNTTKVGIETWNGSGWNEIQSTPFTKAISLSLIHI